MSEYNRIIFVSNSNGSLSVKNNNISQKHKKIITKKPPKKIITKQVPKIILVNKLPTFAEISINDKSNNKEIMNISYIKIGQSAIPNAPFLWYRENQLFCPFEKISKITKQEMNKILVRHNIENNYDAVDNYIVVHRNIINNANMYVSFHGYAYSKDNTSGNNVNNINKKFNKNYIFHSALEPLALEHILSKYCLMKKNLNTGNKAKPLTYERMSALSETRPSASGSDRGIIFAPGSNNYKNNVYIKGNVHIHDLALSPPNHFKFNIDDSMDYVMLLVHGYSEKIKFANCLCLFVIINDNNINDIKIKKINNIINSIESI